MFAYNLSAREAETGGLLQLADQPAVPNWRTAGSESLSQEVDRIFEDDRKVVF